MLKQKLDTITTIETPEAIDIVLRPAGVLPRSMAFLIDFMIRYIWFFLTLMIFLPLGAFGAGLVILNLFFTIWFYYVIFDVFFNGVSLGKRVMGLRTINDDGTPIQFSASFLRNLLRLADTLPMFYTLGIFSCTTHPQAKRIGDIVAGTLVVYTDKANKRPNIPAVPPVASPVVLTQEEQRAVLSFSERNQNLSFERQQELAMIIAPALGVSPIEAVPFLLGIAQNIAGEMKDETGHINQNSFTTTSGQPSMGQRIR